MTAGGLVLDGNVLEIVLIAAAFALFTTAVLIGRLHGLRQRESEHRTIDALITVGEEQEERNAELRREREDILKEGIRAQDALNRWEEVKQGHEQLDQMRSELKAFENEESNLIDKLERRRVEKSRRLAEIESSLDSYPPELTGDDTLWKDAIGQRRKEYDELRQQIDDAGKEYADLESRRNIVADEAARLEIRKTLLEEEIRTAHELLDQITQSQFDILKPQNERLLTELNQLQDKIEHAQKELCERNAKLDETSLAIDKSATELVAKREAIEAMNNATIQFPDDVLGVAVKEMPRTDTRSDGDKLSAFRIMPDCLHGYSEARADTDEDELLDGFESALTDLGLQYPGQIVRAFHTALKVNDLSPLTVLSGLSGTGKSQLPRAYARFFGIHFLHVPVEPGWDSPQDLLGFYDFVSERYRPTDRARALGHFDRKFATDIQVEDDRDWSNRMLIILLDEMNLARTEYYFSEFLSRLEMRGPRANAGGDEDSGADAQIAIDLPYAEKERPKHLLVPHNVLWIGTLNEDETTQALSDKVLDRANSIRFAPPKPKTLSQHSTAPERSIAEAKGHLPYERWLEWSSRQSDASVRQEVNETLESLATLMQSAGRGFGYRITQSINAYIDRYPGQDWRVPMIDQINMRLLPKLAGAEMNNCQIAVQDLKRLCEDTLGNPSFAQALQDAATKSEAFQIFTWPGYTYEEDAL
ncbi:MAG: hypothetical protein OXC26_21840 [Albidovulum sp.]|nr:hypothetical protein [Albidovulum sp.]